MISGHGNIETAVQALKFGAYDFIEKPFKTERLLLTVKRALQQRRLARENAELKARGGRADTQELIGQSSAIKQLQQAIERVAPTASRILITGASGSGKELVARLIHEQSERRDGPFIVASCARLNTTQAGRELFGSEGLQSGRRVIGLFEQAHRGTLYFDEICDYQQISRASWFERLLSRLFDEWVEIQRLQQMYGSFQHPAMTCRRLSMSIIFVRICITGLR